MQKEFLSKNVNKLNRNTKEAQKAVDTEAIFTEHSLDTKSDSQVLKNASTKSIILAPFNSTVSNFEEDDPNFEWPTEVREQIVGRRVIKYNALCRDMNRQYEQNNNADLDNGVYNKFINEQEQEENLHQQQLLQQEEEKKKKSVLKPLVLDEGDQSLTEYRQFTDKELEPPGEHGAPQKYFNLTQEDSLKKSFHETELSDDEERAIQQMDQVCKDTKEKNKDMA